MTSSLQRTKETDGRVQYPLSLKRSPPSSNCCWYPVTLISSRHPLKAWAKGKKMSLRTNGGDWRSHASQRWPNHLAWAVGLGVADSFGKLDLEIVYKRMCMEAHGEPGKESGRLMLLERQGLWHLPKIDSVGQGVL